MAEGPWFCVAQALRISDAARDRIFFTMSHPLVTDKDHSLNILFLMVIEFPHVPMAQAGKAFLSQCDFQGGPRARLPI